MKENYQFRLVNPYQERPNPESDLFDLEVNIGDKIYRGSVTTISFINKKMKEYELTGENAVGKYFCTRNLIILKKIDEETLKATLEDLIKRKDLDSFLEID